MVAKVAGGVLFLGLISTGGIAVAKPHWLGMDYMPKWHSLSEDQGFASSNYSSKFAEKHTRYLVGITGKSNANQSWWEWSYRRLNKAETKTKKFKDVEQGYDPNTNSKALNQVCKEAYEAGSNNVDDAGGENKFKKSEVWKYCSPGKLTTTSEDRGENKYAETKIGGNSDNTSKLISVKDSSNDWFWEIRNEDFWKTDNDWSGSKSTAESDKSIFKKEYETNKGEGEEKERARKTIKDLCGQAYGIDKNDQSNNNNTDALKFCVLEAPNS